MMILITRITILYWTCICIFLYEELFCICCETSQAECVYLFYHYCSPVSFITCCKLYFRHFFGEFVFSCDGVDFAGCSCIMKVYVNA